MSFASFYVLKDCEMLRNTPKHHFGSNRAELPILLRNNFRNFGTLKWCTQARNTSFASFYVPKDSEMLRNTPNIILGLTSRTGEVTSKQFSQLRYPKMVHSGRKHELCILLVPKDSEMLWNTPKRHFRSNGAEQTILLRNNFRNFGTLKWCTQAGNTSFASFYVPKYCEMLQNTPNIILGLTSRIGDFTSKQFSQLRYPKIVHSRPKHEFRILLRAEG
jgi:hypothetical protein